MSPIEHVWDLVCRRLARDPRPGASKDEFLLRIQAIWNSLPQEDIQNLFDSMPRRIAALIAARYCEIEGSIRIPVGQTGYDDKKCEIIECVSGFQSVAGCGSSLSRDPNCFLVKGEGHYPDCCPRPKCHKKKEE
ncbi:transposable element Tcb1 transposase [Trichonephila clavipes]|nr:transposable element Tcb1 transposase [Trichonephila clavipes]